MGNILEVENLCAWYGATQVLFGVDFNVEEGQIVALLGRNGMGKTSTIKSIMNMVQQRAGKLHFDGTDLMKLPSYKTAQLGIGYVPEGGRCFVNLSVDENLKVAARSGYWNMSRVAELFPRLGERGNQNANTLSGGERQMLSIARALMTNPRIMLLDEATEGLAPLIRQEIWKAIHCYSPKWSVYIVGR